jgi:hypothetical protein
MSSVLDLEDQLLVDLTDLVFDEKYCVLKTGVDNHRTKKIKVEKKDSLLKGKSKYEGLTKEITQMKKKIDEAKPKTQKYINNSIDMELDGFSSMTGFDFGLFEEIKKKDPSKNNNTEGEQFDSAKWIVQFNNRQEKADESIKNKESNIPKNNQIINLSNRNNINFNHQKPYLTKNYNKNVEEKNNKNDIKMINEKNTKESLREKEKKGLSNGHLHIRNSNIHFSKESSENSNKVKKNNLSALLPHKMPNEIKRPESDSHKIQEKNHQNNHNKPKDSQIQKSVFSEKSAFSPVSFQWAAMRKRVDIIYEKFSSSNKLNVFIDFYKSTYEEENLKGHIFSLPLQRANFIKRFPLTKKLITNQFLFNILNSQISEVLGRFDIRLDSKIGINETVHRKIIYYVKLIKDKDNPEIFKNVFLSECTLRKKLKNDIELNCPLIKEINILEE